MIPVRGISDLEFRLRVIPVRVILDLEFLLLVIPARGSPIVNDRK